MNKEKQTAHERLLKLCFAAMFAALIFAATRVIQVPCPSGGYMHLGDCFILICSWVLGPVYGFAASAIGSALADATSGFAVYVPGTVLIKGVMASLAAVIMRVFVKKAVKMRTVGFFVSGIVSEVFMVSGYFLYETVFLGLAIPAALEGVVRSSIQGAFGLILGVFFIRVIMKTGILKKMHTYAV
ncbi:MAG: ECF transporter S component [Ruminococcaceae bacterium]|nr:ECF transporter S component [Oscillospiraceae bacterium]